MEQEDGWKGQNSELSVDTWVSVEDDNDSLAVNKSKRKERTNEIKSYTKQPRFLPWEFDTAANYLSYLCKNYFRTYKLNTQN